MMQKFMFVGIGGSGGKTLRFLYQMLEQQLRAVGHHSGVPAAWQFLHVDVPIEADGNSPDLPPQLSSRSYVGMAPRNLTYTQIDSQLVRQGRDVLEHVARWRPRPGQVGINPEHGAGQYRAVGRAITATAVQSVQSGLAGAIRALQDAEANVELAEVAKKVSNDGRIAEQAPQAVVVGSIAGGSGAGALLDVCDAIRGLAPWGKDSAALLFLPDVFADVQAVMRPGMSPNALATVCELMNGYWSDGREADSEYALIRSAGLVPSDPGGRGPRYPLLIGRSNGTISFGGQNDVYRATARAMSAWTMNPEVQDAVTAFFQANWQNAANQNDSTGLTDDPGNLPPFSSMGFASVGLGRDRFARYASQRLARALVQQVLRGHRTDAVVRDQVQTDDEVVEERALGVYQGFLEKSGLRELGPHHNQVIDAIRGGLDSQAREDAKRSLRSQISQAVTSGNEAEANWVQSRILTQVRDRRDGFLDDEMHAEETRARDWYEQVQRAVLHETSVLLGQEGAPVTAEVLDLVIKELEGSVVPELNGMAQSAIAYASHSDERIRSVFSGFTEKIMGNNPVIDKAISEGLNTLHAEAEAQLYRLCAGLIGDLASDCLAPLRDAVQRARRGLEAAEEGTPERPSIVQEWPTVDVPATLFPARNEQLLEPVSDYPDVFVDKLRATFPREGRLATERGALVQAFEALLAGDEDHGELPCIEQTSGWVPREDVLRANLPRSTAAFAIDLTPDSLLERTRRWLERGDTPFGDFLRESLRDYLTESPTVDGSVVAQRLDRFRSRLTEALKASRPLVAINDGIASGFQGRALDDPFLEVATPFPFADGHPARAIVTEVFRHVPDDQLGKLFDDSNRSVIEITTFLAQPSHAAVFDSLMEPVRSQWAADRSTSGSKFWNWRRARPLTQFIPAPADYLREMVRGWCVARVLGRIEIERLNHSPVILHTAQGAMTFPHPLLSAPLQDHEGLLPAVLESMAIAFAHGPDALAPYRYLRWLGGKSSTGDSQRDEAATALESWIADGTVHGDAPLPDPDLAGTPDQQRNERAEQVLAFFTNLRDHFAQLSETPIDGARAFEIPPMWELRHELDEALNALIDDVESYREISGPATSNW